ncbi:peroxiredoxin family protein [Fimbriimonas ginsengisoli]|nr:redoxin domain-containing protein [Fimbriimonas ginsengisoli]
MGTATAQGVTVGSRPARFSAMTIDGRQIFIRDLRNQGAPFFLYFINDRDNLSSRASTEINRMVRGYGKSKAKWYAISNAPADRARSYVVEFKPPYQVLMDDHLSTIQAFGIQNAPAVVMIDREGKVAKIWKGFSGPMLKDLNRTVARVNGKRVRWYDFSRAPSVTTFGEPFIQSRPGAG